jgi:hypothetical protein
VTGRKPSQPALPGMGAGRRVARVRRAVDQQLRAQRAMGHIEPVDAGLTGVALTLADAYDAEVLDTNGSRYVESTIAGRLVAVLLELRGERRDTAGDAGYDDELATLVAAIRNTPRP